MLPILLTTVYTLDFFSKVYFNVCVNVSTPMVKKYSNTGFVLRAKAWVINPVMKAHVSGYIVNDIFLIITGVC